MRVLKFIGITVTLCAVIVIVTNATRGNTAQSQEVRMLETRIIQLEQRLYSIETSLNRLQQSTYSQRSAAPSTFDPEINLIRESLQNLTQRVSEIQCGLLKLDERTAASRTNSGTPSTDPCRLNPGAPLRLSTRP